MIVWFYNNIVKKGYIRKTIFFLCIIIITHLLSNNLIAQNQIIRNGSFENNWADWQLRGKGEIANNISHRGSKSFKVQSSISDSGYIYQYFNESTIPNNIELWVLPISKKYNTAVVLVADWDRFSFDNIFQLSIKSDTISVMTPDSYVAFKYSLDINKWNNISIISDNSIIKKSIYINRNYIGAISSQDFVSAEAILIGDLSTNEYYGTLYFDNIAIKSNRSLNRYDLFLCNLGFGFNFVGPTIEFEISTPYKNNLFSVRYLNSTEFQFSYGHPDYDSPRKKIREIGILYGRCLQTGNSFTSISIGVSFVRGVYRGTQLDPDNFEKKEISTFGLPIEAKFIAIPSSRFGLGFLAFANINNQRSYWGLMIGIQFGK